MDSGRKSMICGEYEEGKETELKKSILYNLKRLLESAVQGKVRMEE